MTERQRVETTYADLRPDDLVVDRSGKEWPVADVDWEDSVDGNSTALVFWLLDSVTRTRLHYMNKPTTDPVTVSRIPSHADEVRRLEADAEVIAAVTASDNFVSLEDAVANVATIAEPEPLVEYTATEFDAANTATDEQPISLPAFESMTPLEQRSHLYLLHGVFSFDLKSREELADMHSGAHLSHDAGSLKSRYIPHVHEAA